jgi:hypothetical protein
MASRGGLHVSGMAARMLLCDDRCGCRLLQCCVLWPSPSLQLAPCSHGPRQAAARTSAPAGNRVQCTVHCPAAAGPVSAAAAAAAGTAAAAAEAAAGSSSSNSMQQSVPPAGFTFGCARCMRASCVPSSSWLGAPPNLRCSMTMKLPAAAPGSGPTWNTLGTRTVPVSACGHVWTRG